MPFSRTWKVWIRKISQNSYGKVLTCSLSRNIIISYTGKMQTLGCRLLVVGGVNAQ